MSDFQREIKERLATLTHANTLSKKKEEFNKVYSMLLVDNDWNEIVSVDDFQASFLDLLNERYLTLFKAVQGRLEERFKEMYRDSDDENERQYKPQDELKMHKIQVPSADSDEWQLMYEMNSDDTIFHIEYDGWTFKQVGITH